MFRKIVIAIVVLIFLVIIGIVAYYLHFTPHLKNSDGDFQPLSHSKILNATESAAEEVGKGLHSAVKAVDSESKKAIGKHGASEDSSASTSSSDDSDYYDHTGDQESSGNATTSDATHDIDTSTSDDHASATTSTTDTSSAPHNTTIVAPDAIPSKSTMALQKSLTMVSKPQDTSTTDQHNSASDNTTTTNAATSVGSSDTAVATNTTDTHDNLGVQPAQQPTALPSQNDMQQAIANGNNMLLAVGTLKYAQSTMSLNALNSGTLGYLHPSAEVKKGDLLYQLGNTTLQNKLVAAEAKETELKQELKELGHETKNLAHESKVTDLRLDILVLQAKIFAYKNSLKQTNFYAPYSGTFAANSRINSGSQIQVGTALGSLEGVKQLTAVGLVPGTVPQNHLVLGQPVIISAMEDGDKYFPAIISSIDDNKEHGYIVHAAIEGDDLGELKSGDFVKMHVLLP